MTNKEIITSTTLLSETQRGDNWVSIVPVEARLENVRSTLRTNTALVSLTFYLMAAEHFCLGGSKVPPANVNISSETLSLSQN